MAGIVSYGAYIPWHRIDRNVMATAWSKWPLKGERSVAFFDEDSLTMGTEAAICCLKGMDKERVDGLYFASMSSPYREKQSSSILAMPLNLKRGIQTADFGGSIRCGATALHMACSNVKSGVASNILVVASDLRLARPGSQEEQLYGDGAAAFWIGSEDVVAEVIATHSLSDEFSGYWKADQDLFVRSWGDASLMQYKYIEIQKEAIKAMLELNSIEAENITTLVFDYPQNINTHMKLAQELGFRPSQVHSAREQHFKVGMTGCALAPMMLVSALENAMQGDLILFLASGNGAEAILFQITEKIQGIQKRSVLKTFFANKKMLDCYNDYLNWREILCPAELSRPPKTHIRLAAVNRESQVLLGLLGFKCTACGFISYDNGASSTTPVHVCPNCHSTLGFEKYEFSSKIGKVFTFTNDFLAPSKSISHTSALINFHGGGRAFFDITDHELSEIKIGTEVELTFRKVQHENGLNNYFWKARPLRSED